jgi:hypothetical protein
MNFPIESGDWALPAKQLAAWVELYPALDVQLELNKAWAWVDANPSRRKTARGMPRFLVSWLNRAAPKTWSDRTPVRQAYDRWKHGGGCPHTPTCPHFTACHVVSQRSGVR